MAKNDSGPEKRDRVAEAVGRLTERYSNPLPGMPPMTNDEYHAELRRIVEVGVSLELADASVEEVAAQVAYWEPDSPEHKRVMRALEAASARADQKHRNDTRTLAWVAAIGALGSMLVSIAALLIAAL